MDGAAPNPQRRSPLLANLGLEALEDRLTPATAAFDFLAASTEPSSVSYQQLSAPVNHPWSDWNYFGISATAFAVEQNANGRMHAVAVTADGKLYERTQVRPNGSWTAWNLAGSNMSKVGMARNADGRLEIFAIGRDNALYQRWQTSPGGGWSEWRRIGGSFRSVEVAMNKDGRLQSFLIGTDAALYERVQTAPGATWTAITRVGGSYTAVRVARQLDGRLEAFALRTDGAISQRAQSTPGGAWTAWTVRPGSFKDLDVAVNADGRLELFAVATTGDLHQRWQTSLGGAWSDWKVTAASLREIEVTRNADGRLQVFGVNTIGRVVSRWQVVAGGRFSTWEDMGSGREIIKVGRNQDGRLEVFVVDNALRLVHRWQRPVQIEPDRAAWNLAALGVDAAWSRGFTGRGVIVAVLDTGVYHSHEDLAGNIWTNPGEIPGNGRDDDGNGFVDDVRGWDFANRDNNPDDRSGHGTHVAGIIAAQANGVGVTGVAPFATIMPVQVLASDGTGSSFDIARGIRYAVDNGANIVNISLGGNYNNPTVAEAIRYAQQKNVLIVAGAGNDGWSSPPIYPAAYSSVYSNVISVGAHDSNYNLAGASNKVRGSGAVQVDAPGVDIFSTAVQNNYRSMTGTSMAAPHVAGVAALVLSANPLLTADKLRQILVQSATHRVTNSDARGGLNAAAAVDLALSPAFLV